MFLEYSKIRVLATIQYTTRQNHHATSPLRSGKFASYMAIYVWNDPTGIMLWYNAF
jgi:hypothetical protein